MSWKPFGLSPREGNARIVTPISPALAVFVLCLTGGALLWAQKPLQLNTYYECNGQRIVVRSCVDQSDKDYNDCIVQLPDRPKAPNGQVATTFMLRRNLVNTIQQCTELGAASAAVPGRGPAGNASGPSTASFTNSLIGFAESGLSILAIAVFTLGVLALIGWWDYNKIIIRAT